MNSIALQIGQIGHATEFLRPTGADARRSLDRFPFDSVLLPYSYVQMRDARYVSDFEASPPCAPSAASRIQMIKAIRLAPWDGCEQTAATWYEPLREQDDVDLAVHWVLGWPGVFLNTVGDVTLLPKVPPPRAASSRGRRTRRRRRSQSGTSSRCSPRHSMRPASA